MTWNTTGVVTSSPFVNNYTKLWLEGHKRYEITNHLGNVMAAINDRKTSVVSPLGIYLPTILSATDYYAFGLEMPGRSYQSGSYRYGFNGKENDRSTWSSTQLVQDYGMRLYNPALGRFLSVDPLAKEYSFYTPYQFAGNTPIDAIDLDGAEPFKKAYIYANNTNPKLNLFHADNLVNMNNALNPPTWNSIGIPRDQKYFWDQWKDTPLGKEALSKDNLVRISNDEAPKVNVKWQKAMEKFGNEGILGEVIEHHHINKGASAMPLPKSLHRENGNYKDLHSMNNRKGP